MRNADPTRQSAAFHLPCPYEKGDPLSCPFEKPKVGTHGPKPSVTFTENATNLIRSVHLDHALRLCALQRSSVCKKPAQLDEGRPRKKRRQLGPVVLDHSGGDRLIVEEELAHVATWPLGCESKGRRMTLELCSKRSEARFLFIAGSRVTFSTELFNGSVVEVAETSSMNCWSILVSNVRSRGTLEHRGICTRLEMGA
jgi:hypothetical protein